MRLFNELFKRKSNKIDEKTLHAMGIKTANVDRVEVERYEPIDPNRFHVVRGVYMDTGEKFTVDLNNMDAFDVLMSCGRPVTILGPIE